MSLILRQQNFTRIDPATGDTVTVIETEEILRVGGVATYRYSDTFRGVVTERPATTNEDLALQTWETEELMGLNKTDAETKLDTWAYVLRDWANDAENVVSQWDTATDAQKDAWMKATIDRLGKLADHLADLLVVLAVKRDA